MPPISVIIPTFRDWRRLELCLTALRRQTIGPDGFEVIVANNDPDDPEPPFVLARNERVVVVAKPGSYAARNAAIADANGQIYAFTDSDCVPEPDWLERALAAIERDPGTRVSGAIAIFREPGTSAYAHLFEFHTAFRQEEYAGFGAAATANLVVARTAFERVGPFDDALLSGGDFDWNLRAADAGVPLRYHPDVIVRHPARRRLAEIFAKRRRVSRSEAVSGRHGLRGYVCHLIAPPLGRLRWNRGTPTMVEKAAVFLLSWALGIYAATQFVLVRIGATKPVRS